MNTLTGNELLCPSRSWPTLGRNRTGMPAGPWTAADSCGAAAGRAARRRAGIAGKVGRGGSLPPSGFSPALPRSLAAAVAPRDWRPAAGGRLGSASVQQS